MRNRSSITTVVVILCCLSAVIQSHADPLDQWHVRNSPSAATGTLEAVAYGSGLFVAVGGSSSPIERETILTSPDGVTWTARSSGNTNRLTAVVHGNGTFVALGTFSPVPFLPATATSVTSSNGIDWVGSASFPSNYLKAVTYGNGVFVAVGYSGSKSAILTSSNGTSWTTHFVDTHSAWGDVAFGNGSFIAASSAGEVLTSPDGFTWTSRPPSPAANALTYGNGLFVLIYGENAAVVSKIFTSPDGSDWSQQGFLGGQYFNNNGFAYGNGRFVLVGSGGRIARLDASGVPVAVLNVENIPFLTGVTYGRGTFVAVGDQGVILQSDPLPTARLAAGRLSEQGLPLTISGEEGLSYRLQTATDLPSTNWTDSLTFTNTAPVTNFVDMEATNFNRRFYRVVSP